MSSSTREYPDSIIPEIRLSELIDIDCVKSMMESFYSLTGIPMSLIDQNGQVLAGAGWQDICIKFHRVCPATSANCRASDLTLTSDIPEGEFRLYKCKNGMWDMATPLFFGKHRIGYLFSGQFFFKDEEPDITFFTNQASMHGFDADTYLEALARVPRVERSYIEKAELFFIKLAETLAHMGYDKMKLGKALDDTKILLSNLSNQKYMLEEGQAIAHLGSWELDLKRHRLTWSDEVYRIFGIDPHDFIPTYEGFLSIIHPDDRDPVAKAYSDSVAQGMEAYEIEHRILRWETGEIRWLHEKCRHFKDSNGKVIRSVGMVHDITDRKKAESDLLKSKEKLISVRNLYRNRISNIRNRYMTMLSGKTTPLMSRSNPTHKYVRKNITIQRRRA